VELWVPEVGGAVDPDNEAHELVMSVFGGMSKGERNRIKLRVRSAMASQAELEGRFLGGRPPYGYKIVEAGVHPNPAKAAEGRRLHVLAVDDAVAPIVQRIFAEYVSGIGIYAIAEDLTRGHSVSVGVRPRPEHASQRHRLVEGRGSHDTAESALHRLSGLEPPADGRDIARHRRRRARLHRQDALEPAGQVDPVLMPQSRRHAAATRRLHRTCSEHPGVSSQLRPTARPVGDACAVHERRPETFGPDGRSRPGT